MQVQVESTLRSRENAECCYSAIQAPLRLNSVVHNIYITERPPNLRNCRTRENMLVKRERMCNATSVSHSRLDRPQVVVKYTPERGSEKNVSARTCSNSCSLRGRESPEPLPTVHKPQSPLDTPKTHGILRRLDREGRSTRPRPTASSSGRSRVPENAKTTRRTLLMSAETHRMRRPSRPARQECARVIQPPTTSGREPPRAVLRACFSGWARTPVR